MILNKQKLEEYILQEYPELFREWEFKASDLLDFDEWLEREYSDIFYLYKDKHDGVN